MHRRAWLALLALATGCARDLTAPAPRPMRYDPARVPCENVIHRGVPVCGWVLEKYGRPGVG